MTKFEINTTVTTTRHRWSQNFQIRQAFVAGRSSRLARLLRIASRSSKVGIGYEVDEDEGIFP